jgi:hypothetical protein
MNKLPKAIPSLAYDSGDAEASAFFFPSPSCLMAAVVPVTDS